MAKRSPLTDKNGEVRELTTEDFKHFKPAAEVLPAELVAVLPKRRPGQRGPGKRPAKEAVNIRLAPEVVEAFRAMGRGWQTRINDVLREWLKEHKSSA